MKRADHKKRKLAEQLDWTDLRISKEKRWLTLHRHTERYSNGRSPDALTAAVVTFLDRTDQSRIATLCICGSLAMDRVDFIGNDNVKFKPISTPVTRLDREIIAVVWQKHVLEGT
ncbi:hypothetical protein KPH14_008074 [Odynerus spinipes]|uniref:Uncharacterized protein n=1 Tax=Odynerus spinipes TaxID=1348599 RepID=A0AAD9RLA7_9HYME|nr:hypothetical protein KPH14_008074 [Odynerus spinipes]